MQTLCIRAFGDETKAMHVPFEPTDTIKDISMKAMKMAKERWPEEFENYTDEEIKEFFGVSSKGVFFKEEEMAASVSAFTFLAYSSR